MEMKARDPFGPSSTPEALRELEKLDQAVSALDNTFAALVEALQPFLRDCNDAPCPTSSPREVVSSRAGLLAEGIKNSVEVITTRILETKNRL